MRRSLTHSLHQMLLPWAVTLTLGFVSSSWGQTSGSLSQSSETDGCISEDGSGATCEDGKGLNGAGAVALSPSGRHVYVTSMDGDAVAVLNRNKVPGALSQSTELDGCVSETGSGPCTDGKALNGAAAVVVSPDGKHVYVASFGSDAVVAFIRDNGTGVLTQLTACTSETGSDSCANGRGLDGATAIAMSNDGKNVYVASAESDAVAVFARDKVSGVLTQLSGNDGCISETGAGPCADGKALVEASSIVVSLDGKSVYVASKDSDAVAVFARDKDTGVLTQLSGNDGCISETGTGPCVDGKALDGAVSVVISKNGKHVYVASQVSNAVAVFARDRTTGALLQLADQAGCVSNSGSGGTCATGRALDGPSCVTMSHNGEHVYVASSDSNAVAVFARNKAFGALSQLPGAEGCVSETDATCTAGKAVTDAIAVVVSRDGKHVYVASPTDDAVAVLKRAK